MNFKLILQPENSHTETHTQYLRLEDLDTVRKLTGVPNLPAERVIGIDTDYLYVVGEDHNIAEAIGYSDAKKSANSYQCRTIKSTFYLSEEQFRKVIQNAELPKAEYTIEMSHEDIFYYTQTNIWLNKDDETGEIIQAGFYHELDLDSLIHDYVNKLDRFSE